MADTVATTESPSADFACSVNAELFARVALGVSTAETRYYLRGVFVEPCPAGGVTLAATDGHIMIVGRDPDGWVRQSSILKLNKAMLAAAIKPIIKGPAVAKRVVATPTRAAIVSSYLRDNKKAGQDDLTLLSDLPISVIAFQWGATCIDGSFPDWRRALPTFDKFDFAGSIAINLEYLARVKKALAGKNGFVTMRMKDDSGPVLVTGPDSNIFGIVMPMRSLHDREVPSWSKLPEKAAPKAKAKAASTKKPAKRKAA